ncbi:hypothetical protein Lsed01_00663 [Demequina sediminis]|uniref:Uncharacterized protein n=1 Tax=Demequina sediminis TaxID=1930058 RepID=A0ABP9WEG4_9MICO|nr:hypothetical protein [Demequina sediminis]BDZ62024.1 hypothetical protein GCM10025873_18150 [Demequina sediminis]
MLATAVPARATSDNLVHVGASTDPGTLTLDVTAPRAASAYTVTATITYELGHFSSAGSYSGAAWTFGNPGTVVAQFTVPAGSGDAVFSAEWTPVFKSAPDSVVQTVTFTSAGPAVLSPNQIVVTLTAAS